MVHAPRIGRGTAGRYYTEKRKTPRRIRGFFVSLPRKGPRSLGCRILGAGASDNLGGNGNGSDDEGERTDERHWRLLFIPSEEGLAVTPEVAPRLPAATSQQYRRMVLSPILPPLSRAEPLLLSLYAATRHFFPRHHATALAFQRTLLTFEGRGASSSRRSCWCSSPLLRGISRVILWFLIAIRAHGLVHSPRPNAR